MPDSDKEKAPKKDKKPKKGVFFVLGFAAIAVITAVMLALLDRNTLRVMSFNIKNDEGSMWAVRVVFDMDFSFKEYEQTDEPPPPPDWSTSAEKIYITVDEDGDLEWFFVGWRMSKVVDSIAAVNPDILGLQEAFYDQVQFIAKIFNYGYYARGRDGGHDGETNGVLWNKNKVSPIAVEKIGWFDLYDVGTFWYSDTPDVEGSIPLHIVNFDAWKDWGQPQMRRIASWARLKVNQTGRQFYFFNTHLQNSGNAGDGTRNRMKQAELLMQRITARSVKNTAVILTGDFNATPTSTPIDLITEGSVEDFGGRAWVNATRMKDTFKKIHPDSNDGTHCTGFTMEAGTRIDYVLTTLWVFMREAAIISGDVCASDHRPVSAKVSFL